MFFFYTGLFCYAEGSLRKVTTPQLLHRCKKNDGKFHDQIMITPSSGRKNIRWTRRIFSSHNKRKKYLVLNSDATSVGKL